MRGICARHGMRRTGRRAVRELKVTEGTDKVDARAGPKACQPLGVVHALCVPSRASADADAANNSLLGKELELVESGGGGGNRTRIPRLVRVCAQRTYNINPRRADYLRNRKQTTPSPFWPTSGTNSARPSRLHCAPCLPLLGSAATGADGQTLVVGLVPQRMQQRIGSG